MLAIVESIDIVPLVSRRAGKQLPRNEQKLKEILERQSGRRG
jgi:hypothetical protein